MSIYRPPAFQYQSYTTNLDSISKIIRHMESLDDQLKNTDLHNLRAFNHTYLIITQAVAAKIGTNYFSDDDQMQQLDINFAYYYFNALYDYLRERPISSAWQLLFDLCKKNRRYQFIYMALGVSAHVNNDLGQSLYDTVKNEAYQADFDKVNMIIHSKTYEVITWLHEDSKIINKTKKFTWPLYSLILSFIIEKWRQNAWLIYLKLKNNVITKDEIEKNATVIGKYLSTIRKLLFLS